MRDLEQNFISNLLQHFECRATKLRVNLEEGRCSAWKENLLNMFSKKDFVSITFITCYSDTDTQDSPKFIPNFSFTCRLFTVVEILNHCACITLKPLILLSFT